MYFRSLVENFRQLCTEDEKSKQELRVVLQNHSRLMHSQKESFLNAAYSEVQEGELEFICYQNKI